MWLFSFWEEICKYFARMNQQNNDNMSDSVDGNNENEQDVGLDIDRIDGNASVLDNESHKDEELKEELKEQVNEEVKEDYDETMWQNNSETNLYILQGNGIYESKEEEPVKEEVKEEPVKEELVEEPVKEEPVEEPVKEEEIVVLQDPTIFSKEGKKKALLIGINYNTDDNEGDDLNGCENDMNRLSDWIQAKCYFNKEDINRLDSEKATREAIENGIMDLLEFAKSNPNSELWLSYSGHGSYYFSTRESDYQNEILCPSDYLTKGFISDDWLKREFVDKLPGDCKVFALMDCCHSGSNMDLPYCLKDNSIVLREKMEVKENMANVIKFSGCLDSQVSMDYYNRNMREFQGAFTNSFVMSNKNQLFRDTLEGLNLHLRTSGFKQISELALSNPELWLWKLYE